MKSVLLFFIYLPFVCLSQTDTLPRNKESGKYEYTEVINVDSATAEKLYSNAKLFIVEAFNSGKDVTQMNDDAAKTVAGAGNMLITFRGIALSGIDKRVKFKVLIQCKDGRYKYIISDFVYRENSTKGIREVDLSDEQTIRRSYVYKNQYPQLMQKVSDEMKHFVSNMKKHMNSEAAVTKDW